MSSHFEILPKPSEVEAAYAYVFDGSRNQFHHYVVGIGDNGMSAVRFMAMVKEKEAPGQVSDYELSLMIQDLLDRKVIRIVNCNYSRRFETDDILTLTLLGKEIRRYNGQLVGTLWSNIFSVIARFNPLKGKQ